MCAPLPLKTSTRVGASVYVCMYVCMYVVMYIYIYIYIYIYMYVTIGLVDACTSQGFSKIKSWSKHYMVKIQLADTILLVHVYIYACIYVCNYLQDSGLAKTLIGQNTTVQNIFVSACMV
jgi:hypothetical protein